VGRENANCEQGRAPGSRLAAEAFACAFLVLTLFILGASSLHADDQKRVLIVHSRDATLPIIGLAEAAVRRKLQARLPSGFKIFVEYLDKDRFPGSELAARTEEFLRAKYMKYRIDLVISTGPEALDFLLERRASLFSNAPLVATDVSAETIKLRTLPADVAAVVSRLDIEATLELALRLQPGVEHVAVITGSSARDRSWEERARTALSAYAERLDIRYLSGLRMPQVLEQVSHLQRGTIVLYIGILQDAAGDDFVPRDVAQKVAEIANGPVYSIFTTYFGRGIVGGNMDTYETLGSEAADLGLDMMAGRQVPSVTFAPSANFVDWRQLQRWGLDKSRLPPNSAVLFKEPSPWKRHKWQLGLVGALLIAQSALIAALLVQSRRRLRAERAALESEERISLATTSASLGLWHWEIGSNRLWVSEICRKIVGLEPNANVSLEKFLALIGREDLAAPQHPAALPVIAKRLDREHQLEGADGENIWIRTVGRTRYDASGLPVGMTGVVIDASQDKTAERELAHWRQELMHRTRVETLGALSGAMAHELNQPLTAILGNANAANISLRRGQYDVSEMGEVLSDIETEAMRAGDIIRHLRALFVKAESSYEALDVNQIVAEVLKLMHSDLVARKVNVTLRSAPNLPAVQGDRVQLQQVLLNLISNACEAMNSVEPGERDLMIMTAPDGRASVMVSISDRGTGLPADIVQRLFRPFVTTKARGLGLGLSISRSIVESHGGVLRVDQNPNRGATFCVALPTNAGERV
jgi:signal transduction histidine kinase